jgi:hypothetical protein
MLKTQIKKSLLETKERKEKLLIEEKLIKNRLSIIVENIRTEEDFKSLSKRNQLKLSVKFLQELSYLGDSNLVNEGTLTNALHSIFGNAFGNVVQTLLEPVLGAILSKLGFHEGFFKNFIISALTTSPTELIGALNDCKIMTKLIVKSGIEAQVMTLQKDSGLSGIALDFVRNTLGSIANDQKIVQDLENGLSGAVCDLIGKFTNNAKNVKSRLMNNVPTTTSLIPSLT